MKSNKLTYGIIVIAMMGLAVMIMGANSIANDIPVDQSHIVEDVAAFEEVSNPAVTSVEWHGTVDLYLKEAGTDEWVQVVQGEPNLITDIGANRIRGLLNGSIANPATIANLSLSDSVDSASAAWTELPAEIAANGLERATGTMANNGTGAFNITYTWTATASQDCQLIGTHWDETGELDGNLFSALDFAQQTLLVNDQLQAVYSVEIS